MQIAVAIRKMLVNFFDSEAIIVQVAEAGVRQVRVESAQLAQVKRVVLAVIEPGEKSHQAFRAAGGGVCIDGGFNYLQWLAANLRQEAADVEDFYEPRHACIWRMQRPSLRFGGTTYG